MVLSQKFDSVRAVQAVREAGWQGDWATRQPEEEYLEWVVLSAEEQGCLPVEVLFVYLADVLLHLHEDQARRGEFQSQSLHTANILPVMSSAASLLDAARTRWCSCCCSLLWLA